MVMPSSLRKKFEALKIIPPSSIESEKTFSVTGFYITKFRCPGLFIAYFLRRGTRTKRKDRKSKIGENITFTLQASAKNLDKTFC